MTKNEKKHPRVTVKVGNFRASFGFVSYLLAVVPVGGDAREEVRWVRACDTESIPEVERQETLRQTATRW